MKKIVNKMVSFLLIFVAMIGFSLINLSCEDESYKDAIMLDIEGTWDILSEKGNEGTVEFTHDETFTVTTADSTVTGDANAFIEENLISISYAETEDGEEYLTEEEYENGYFVTYKPIDDKSCYMTNLPLFRNRTIILNKK